MNVRRIFQHRHRPARGAGQPLHPCSGLAHGDCRAIFETDPATGREILWLLAADAWASVLDGQVRQAGARKLWDEAVAAYQWWLQHNRPDRRDFGLTITPERQWVWLDHPANTITALI